MKKISINFFRKFWRENKKDLYALFEMLKKNFKNLGGRCKSQFKKIAEYGKEIISEEGIFNSLDIEVLLLEDMALLLEL